MRVCICVYAHTLPVVWEMSLLIVWVLRNSAEPKVEGLPYLTLRAIFSF